MQINAFWLMLGALGVYAIAYRYYSGFIANRVLQLDNARVTPAHRLNDGQNYHPTNKWVLWGHHFAAIAGAGPLIGPVLAAQFGYLPGFLWLVFGVCLGGAVQDFVILVASARRNGRSLAEIARAEISPVSGIVAMIAILFIIIVSLAVLGFVVVKALADSPWGTFTILMSIPIALFMGLYMYRIRPGKIGEGSAIGVALLFVMVILGGLFQPGGAWAEYSHWLTFSEKGITTGMVIYGFIASVLPVWLLLCPRDYLSSYMKVGTVALIALAVLTVRPAIQQPMFSQFIHGGGPIVKGPIFPFVFITIACGAISGFHSLVASGTTPKMVDQETQCRPIGYGAMLMESLVGVTALIAACSLPPSNYFEINLKPEDFAALAATMNLDKGGLSDLAHLVGEANLAGRTGGGVSLAVGIARIFGHFPGLDTMMSYFYHFVIMFEALFVLTTIDTGTRIARFLVQECSGRFYKPTSLAERNELGWVGAGAVVFGCIGSLFLVVKSISTTPPLPFSLGVLICFIVCIFAGLVLLALNHNISKSDWMPATIAASSLVVTAWSYFIYTGSIQTLWPMFGVANQLLAVVALAVGTTVLINEGRAKYAWITIAPMLFVGTTTVSAGFLSVKNIFLPMTQKPETTFQGYLLSTLTSVMMLCAIAVLIDAVPRWARYWNSGREETLEMIKIPPPEPQRRSDEAAEEAQAIGILEPNL
jgi:carbon starvation protein